jgi:hypothetical protein
MTQDVEINRVLLAALRQIEALALEVPLTEADLMRSRELGRFLDDARTADVLFGARTGWVVRARSVAQGRLDDYRLLLTATSWAVFGPHQPEPSVRSVRKVLQIGTMP